VRSIDLGALGRLLEHKAEDMTATVEAGITLAELQQQLAARGQWLPIDPPKPEELTIGAILENNASGPRRLGYGTIRDYVLGMTVVLADGRLIHSGGKVVKNVAGYDLMKLFIGSRGSLGVIVEATFKVLPLPEHEQFVQAQCESLDAADKLIESLSNSELVPIVMDLHNMSANAIRTTLVLGFAGTRDGVEWQLSQASQLGVNQPSSLEYQSKYFTATPSFQKLSVLPSKLIGALRSLENVPFVARVGNGIIYHSGPMPLADAARSTGLEARLKKEFDSKHIFPDFQ
jgi:FAD/FMN-containing dehydrogenase